MVHLWDIVQPCGFHTLFMYHSSTTYQFLYFIYWIVEDFFFFFLLAWRCVRWKPPIPTLNYDFSITSQNVEKADTALLIDVFWITLYSYFVLTRLSIPDKLKSNRPRSFGSLRDHYISKCKKIAKIEFWIAEFNRDFDRYTPGLYCWSSSGDGVDWLRNSIQWPVNRLPSGV